MKFTYKIFTLLLFSISSFAQPIIDTISPTDQIPMELIQRLEGVRFVDMYQSDEYVNYLSNNTSDIGIQLVLGFVNFLKEDLERPVAITSSQLEQLNGELQSICEVVKVDFNAEFESDLLAIGRITNIQAGFLFCDGSIFYLKLPEYGVTGNTRQHKKIQRKFRERFPYAIPFDSAKTLSLPTLEIVSFQSNSADSLLQDSTASPFEGVYQYFSGSQTHVSKLAVMKHENNLKLIYLEGEGRFANDWQKGEVKAVLVETKSPNDFIVKITSGNKQKINGSLTFSENSFTINANSKSYRFIML
jgi:hypothetical protein